MLIRHIRGIQAIHGDLSAYDLELHQIGSASPLHLHTYLRAFRSPKALHDIGSPHLHARDHRIVHLDDTIARHQSNLLGGTTGNYLNHVHRIGQHIELNTNTIEITLQRLIHLLGLLRIHISGMRV